MGSLHVTHSVDRAARRPPPHVGGESLPRQGRHPHLEQLRADLALDLLTGRAMVDEATGLVHELEMPAFARPVVNVTVPIQTLMGVSDDPGVLTGGTVLPATLARMIAQKPGSTWHRMLTDEAGHCVEVSTRS